LCTSTEHLHLSPARFILGQIGKKYNRGTRKGEKVEEKGQILIEKGKKRKHHRKMEKKGNIRDRGNNKGKKRENNFEKVQGMAYMSLFQEEKNTKV
jgi:hypothetical protein